MLDYKGVKKRPIISKVELERNKRFTKNLLEYVLSYHAQEKVGDRSHPTG